MPESEMTDATSKPATLKKVADDARERLAHFHAEVSEMQC
jgi:hypothetical protein